MSNEFEEVQLEFENPPIENGENPSLALLDGNIPSMFTQADQLLFKQRRFADARTIYEQILTLDSENIDAINSIAYCVKFAAASSSDSLPDTLFTELESLYNRTLEIDQDDIEANFNLGSLYL